MELENPTALGCHDKGQAVEDCDSLIVTVKRKRGNVQESRDLICLLPQHLHECGLRRSMVSAGRI